MEGQGNAAVLTLLDMPAFGTEHGGVEPSTVEKENALFAGGAALSQGFYEWSGKHGVGIPSKSFTTHVHDVHDREFSTIYTMSEFDHSVFARPNVSNGLQRRSGGTEHAGGVGQHGTIYRHVPAVITRGLILFVGGFVLLVDYHKAQISQGSENSGSRPHDDTGSS
jgi:hypothetical protein